MRAQGRRPAPDHPWHRKWFRTEFAVVPRPVHHVPRHGRWAMIQQAVARTLDTDTAVRVPLDKEPLARIRNGIAKPLRTQGLRVLTVLDGDHLLCWVEGEMTDEHLQRGLPVVARENGVCGPS